MNQMSAQQIHMMMQIRLQQLQLIRAVQIRWTENLPDSAAFAKLVSSRGRMRANVLA